MKKIGYGNNFNILRFFFAALVIVSHAPELQNGDRSKEILTRVFGTISFGEMAVDSFFVLSGFLIVQSWQVRPHIFAFLSSRILRIYPGFIVSSLVCALVVGPVYGMVDYFYDFHWGKFLAGLARLTLSGIPTVFADAPHSFLNGAVWTISYEFKCYLLVLVCGSIGVLKKRGIWLSIFLLGAAVHVLNRLEAMEVPFDVYFRLVMPFAAGGCFYLYRNEIPWNVKAAWVSLFIFAGFLFVKPLVEPALSIFFGYSVLCYAMKGKSLLWFNRLPDVSYGVYLYAWPINQILLWHHPSINVYASMGIVFVLSVIAGTVSWYVVEKPFMKLKKQFRRGELQPAEAVPALLQNTPPR